MFDSPSLPDLIMLDDQSTKQDQAPDLEVIIPASLMRKISQIAVAKGITLEDAMTEAVAQYLNKNNFTID